MLALVPESQIMRMADLFETPGHLCIKLEVQEDGSRHTTYSAQGMNDWEVLVTCREVALACTLKRMVGWSDPREELDTLGMDPDTKLCITYRSHRQNFGWMRKNVSYQDAEIMCIVVEEIAKRQLFPDESIK